MTTITEHLSRRTKLMYGVGDAGINAVCLFQPRVRGPFG